MKLDQRKKEVTISFRISHELSSRLEQYCRRHNIKKSDLLRELISNLLLYNEAGPILRRLIKARKRLLILLKEVKQSIEQLV